MKILRILALTSTALFASHSASAKTISGHSCQVLGLSNQVAYHTAGSIIALKDNVRVSCPINRHDLSGSISARVLFSTRNVRLMNVNYITCHLNKVSEVQGSHQGSKRSARIQVRGALNITNDKWFADVIGANIVCTLQKEAKIRGIQVQ